MSGRENRKLADLRVVDLRAELEKRGLESRGVKATLVQRLQKTIADEGHAPDEYTFETVKRTHKRTKRGGKVCKAVRLEVDQGSTEKEGDNDKNNKVENGDECLEEKKLMKAEGNSETESNGDDVESRKYEVTVDAVKEDITDGTKEMREKKAVNQEVAAGVGSKKKAAVQGQGKRSIPRESSQKKKNDRGGDKSKSATQDAGEKATTFLKEKKAPVAGSGRSLWVIGLSPYTRATYLKHVFSKYGKVIGAKVLTNARNPGARCYGFLNMATSYDAYKCIQHLNCTELNGRMISVKMSKRHLSGPPKKAADCRVIAAKKPGEKKYEKKPGISGPKAGNIYDKDEKVETSMSDGETAKRGGKPEGGDTERAGEGDTKKAEVGKGGVKHGPSLAKPGNREVLRYRSKRQCGVGSSHNSLHSRPVSQSHQRGNRTPLQGHANVRTFTQTRKERVRQQWRERERDKREEDCRRAEEEAWLREMKKRQHEEAIRLEREKERLQLERKYIERLQAELMCLKQVCKRLETEKLEREELKRQEIRFERGHSFHMGVDSRPDGMRHSGRDGYAESPKEGSRYPDQSGYSWQVGGVPPPVKPFSSMGSGGGPSMDSWRPITDRVSDGQSWGRHMENSLSDRWVRNSSHSMGDVGRRGPGMGGPSMYAGQPGVPPIIPRPYGGDRFHSYKQYMGPIPKY